MPVQSSKLFFAAAALAAALLLVLPAPAGMAPGQMRTAALLIFAIGLWSTSVVPAFLGSLIFLFAAMVTGVAPAKVVFSGFYADAMWLVFGGLVIGLGVKRSGLDLRLVRNVLAHFPRTYLPLLYGVFLMGTGLSFLVPSASGRVTLLVPITMALAKRIGFRPGAKGQAGVVLAGAMGTLMPAFGVLPANVPNMALYGAADSIYGIQLAYGDYFALNFPVLGLGAILAYPALIALLFPDQPRPPEEDEANGAWSSAEKRLGIIILCALALWVTDALHGVSPAWVALGAALLCVLPRIGMLEPQAITREIDYGPVLFLAGIIGLGAVATHGGLGELIAERLLTIFDMRPDNDAANFAVLSAIGTIVQIGTTLPAQPAVMAPMAQVMAEATGWPLMSVLMVPVATWMLPLFVYQAPPLVITVALAELRMGWVIRMLFAYLVFGIVVLFPLHYLWGRWLGYFTAGG